MSCLLTKNSSTRRKDRRADNSTGLRVDGLCWVIEWISGLVGSVGSVVHCVWDEIRSRSNLVYEEVPAEDVLLA